jgi:propionyl-CoA synthetase
MVRKQICSFTLFNEVALIKRLLKTRSGKNRRGTNKRVADREPNSTPPIIDNSVILDEIRADLAGKAFPKS